MDATNELDGEKWLWSRDNQTVCIYLYSIFFQKALNSTFVPLQLAYTNWHPTAHNKVVSTLKDLHCAGVSLADFTWKDSKCTESAKFICRKTTAQIKLLQLLARARVGTSGKTVELSPAQLNYVLTKVLSSQHGLNDNKAMINTADQQVPTLSTILKQDQTHRTHHQLTIDTTTTTTTPTTSQTTTETKAPVTTTLSPLNVHDDDHANLGTFHYEDYEVISMHEEEAEQPKSNQSNAVHGNRGDQHEDEHILRMLQHNPPLVFDHTQTAHKHDGLPVVHIVKEEWHLGENGPILAETQTVDGVLTTKMNVSADDYVELLKDEHFQPTSSNAEAESIMESIHSNVESDKVDDNMAVDDEPKPNHNDNSIAESSTEDINNKLTRIEDDLSVISEILTPDTKWQQHPRNFHFNKIESDTESRSCMLSSSYASSIVFILVVNLIGKFLY
jgi:hypothetical protein